MTIRISAKEESPPKQKTEMLRNRNDDIILPDLLPPDGSLLTPQQEVVLTQQEFEEFRKFSANYHKQYMHFLLERFSDDGGHERLWKFTLEEVYDRFEDAVSAVYRDSSDVNDEEVETANAANSCAIVATKALMHHVISRQMVLDATDPGNIDFDDPAVRGTHMILMRKFLESFLPKKPARRRKTAKARPRVKPRKRREAAR